MMQKSSSANNREQETSSARPQMVGEGQHPDKMQGHWVLARAGKRVLRPGGLELTRQMLDALAINPQDRVVEFAPGLGVTARMVLRCRPSAYWGVEREPAAAEYLRRQLVGDRCPDCARSGRRIGVAQRLRERGLWRGDAEHAESRNRKTGFSPKPGAFLPLEDGTESTSCVSCLTIFRTMFATRFKRQCRKRSMWECNRCPGVNG